MRRYRVSAKPHPVFRGYRLEGIWFPNAPDSVELRETELTDAIRQCPLLQIEEVQDDPTDDFTLGVACAQATAAGMAVRARAVPACDQRGALAQRLDAPLQTVEQIETMLRQLTLYKLERWNP